MDNLRVFGPVPSRRLGRSLGINNIPPKICSYSCVYCQLGRSLEMTAQRNVYYNPEELYQLVEIKVHNLRNNQENIDYLTIVPDGEPTLDKNLGSLIDLLKPLGIKIAIITNSSLLHDPNVRMDVMKADWVSVKVDSLYEKTWKEIDRPHGKLKLDKILTGIQDLKKDFKGQLVSETMLVKGINDKPAQIKQVAQYLAGIQPSKVYLSIPTRPPAEAWVSAPAEKDLNIAFQIFLEHGLRAEHLIGYEGNEFSFSGDLENDLLAIISVHPMREDALSEYVEKAGGMFSVVEDMVKEGKIVRSEYQRNHFYIRKFKSS